MRLQSGALRAALAAAGFSMPGASAWAHAQGDSPRVEETVIVTGVRGAPRTVIDSPTPIDVLGATEIERVGRAGTLQALSTLAPSFTVPTRAGGGTASVISTGGLRGLNPDQTLILVNGKRRHKSSLINAVSALYLGSVPVDLDMIATSAIGRIEVLRDGAAAQYGSDAIADVINIILKDDSDGGAASATWSQNFDRSDGQVVQGSANYGFPIMDDGYLHIAVSGEAQKQSNRALPLPTTLPIFRPGDPRESTVNRTIFGTYGQYPQEGLNTALNLAIPMDGDMEFYSFGTFSVRESRLPFTVRLNNSDRTTGSNTALPEVYPNGFVPTQVIDETDYDLAIGLKGIAAGWDWDLSAVWGGNIADQTTVNNINASLGPTSPRSFVIGSLASSDLTVSADFTRAWQTAMGELQTSFGLQVRRETYSVKQGDPLGYLTGSYVIPAG